MAAERTKGHYNLYLSSENPRFYARRATLCRKKRPKATNDEYDSQEKILDDSIDAEIVPSRSRI